MTQDLDLEFCFKGERTYVHGTDIFNTLTKQFNTPLKKIDIAFHGIVLNNMSFSTQKPENDEVKVSFRCQNGEEKVRLFGTENSKNVTCRYEYIEEELIEDAVIDMPSESISLQSFSSYSFIEYIVAMNKSFLETRYEDEKGKWYFTRLQLSSKVEINDVTSIQIILKSNFQFKLTKSAIVINEQEVGYIYFSLIPKES